jgi:general secretion pathway protein K
MRSRQSFPVGQVRRRRGSILVVVLLTLVFATTALMLFIERAGTDLMVHVRDADRMRLRQEAYSALETTLAVLNEFREVIGALHSPNEGWNDPLDWAGYEPAEGRKVTVDFRDESGKISVSQLDYQKLFDLFESWDENQRDAELWADAIMGWMSEEYTPSTFEAPRLEDYERADPGFHPPMRLLRSFAELRAIDVIREEFFNKDGYPNDRGRRFMDAISLFEFSQTNVNSAPGSVLSAVGRYDLQQQELLDDYRSGAGIYRGNGKGYFTSNDELSGIVGEGAGADSFGTEIQALRIIVTVTEGPSEYRLNVVISPNGGARINTTDPIPRKGENDEDEAAREAEEEMAEATDDGAGGGTTPTGKRVSAAALAVAETAENEETSLEYPFTLLEIREIDGPEQPAVAATATL